MTFVLKKKFMYNVSVDIADTGEGSFVLLDSEKRAVQINITLREDVIIIRETIISARKHIRAVVSRLLYEIVEYARMHELKIITLSRTVQQRFHQHPGRYQDVWESSS